MQRTITIRRLDASTPKTRYSVIGEEFALALHLLLLEITKTNTVRVRRTNVQSQIFCPGTDRCVALRPPLQVLFDNEVEVIVEKHSLLDVDVIVLCPQADLEPSVWNAGFADVFSTTAEWKEVTRKIWTSNSILCFDRRLHRLPDVCLFYLPKILFDAPVGFIHRANDTERDLCQNSSACFQLLVRVVTLELAKLVFSFFPCGCCA